MSRRESWLVATHLPGNYSAMIRPFEQLPRVPGQGGVTIVEVYEVNGR